MYTAKKTIQTITSINGLAVSSQTLSTSNVGGSPLSISVSSVGSTHTLSSSLATIPVLYGGTGQTSVAAAFGALSPLTTKGDLLSYTTANARVPVGYDGWVLYADSSQSSGLRWGALPEIQDPILTDARFSSAARTSDLGRTSSTTPADDPQLTLAVASNSYYRFTLILTHSCPTSGINLKIGWGVPSGSVMGWQGTTNVRLTDASTATITNSGSETMFTTHGWLYTGANNGSFTLKWSQGTTSGSATTLLKGSLLSIEKIG